MQRLSDGRVRRSREEWRVLLARMKKSGVSEASFCAREKISRSTLSHWKRKLADEGSPAPGGVPFVELSAPPKELDAEPATGSFELLLPGGVTLRWKA